MDKSAKIDSLVGILVFIVLLVSLVPVVMTFIGNADDMRLCTNPSYPNECLDNDDGLLNWCSNETDGTLYCLDADLPVFNSSYELCTNTSGVGIVNDSATSVCDSIGWADGIVAYEDIGLSPVEVTLLGLIILILVLGGLYAFIKSSGLMKK